VGIEEPVDAIVTASDPQRPQQQSVLLVAVVLTQVVLQNYDGVDTLSGAFVWPLAARNLTLLVYLWLVCRPVLEGEAADARQPALGTAAA